MEFLLNPEVWAAFVTLTLLEIVLGIDNIIFIAILVGRLPEAQRARARTIGLALAMLTRIGLLLSIAWVMGLTAALFTAFRVEVSWRDIILIVGGGFLIAKSTMEIHNNLEGEEHAGAGAAPAAFLGTVIQIMIIDIVFSLDSVITAVGLAQHVEIMIAAIVIAVLAMMAAAGAISAFVDRHPTIKMLALSFLILIGVALIGEGMDLHIPKGYIYFAMAFSVVVEMLNLRVRRRRAEPVKLRKAMTAEEEG
jgi:predicted tellurium resistance membrane protein TerC